MINLSYPILIEFFVGLFLWWVAVYLFLQNPFSRLVQLLAGIFTCISFYLSSDIFFIVANNTHQYYLNGLYLKSFIWTLYLSAPFLYHVSYLLIPKNLKKQWQKYVLYLAYLATAVVIYLESGTNLTRNYSVISAPSFTGNLPDATGKYFWLVGAFFILIFLATTINFYLLTKKEAKFSKNWYKYFLPFCGLAATLVLGPLILLSYYNIIPHPYFFGSVIMVIVAFPLIYSILKYDLLIEEAKLIFGKSFLYFSLTVAIILLLYYAALFSAGVNFSNIKTLVPPFILSYLIILSHPAYDWLTTFVRDLIFNISSGISVVNDAEVYEGLKNYNNPEELEDSPLLRLKLIDTKIRSGQAKTPVDALRQILKEAVSYFEPEHEEMRRTKKNIKYHLLKMIAYDEAEEGQILWELGFEDYPLNIMAKESEQRAPIFKISAPSDYSYISRNAFIGLKKEAIHDVAWQISYLEKLTKKR